MKRTLAAFVLSIWSMQSMAGLITVNYAGEDSGGATISGSLLIDTTVLPPDLNTDPNITVHRDLSGVTDFVSGGVDTTAVTSPMHRDRVDLTAGTGLHRLFLVNNAINFTTGVERTFFVTINLNPGSITPDIASLDGLDMSDVYSSPGITIASRPMRTGSNLAPAVINTYALTGFSVSVNTPTAVSEPNSFLWLLGFALMGLTRARVKPGI